MSMKIDSIDGGLRMRELIQLIWYISKWLQSRLPFPYAWLYIIGQSPDNSHPSRAAQKVALALPFAAQSDKPGQFPTRNSKARFTQLHLLTDLIHFRYSKYLS